MTSRIVTSMARMVNCMNCGWFGPADEYSGHRCKRRYDAN